MPLYDKFYIGAPKDPYTGQVTRHKPFLIPSSAFERLRNMYNYREAIRKRPGALVMDTTQSAADQQLFTRLRINIATTAAGSGNLVATVVPGTVFEIGQAFSIGTTKFTVHQNGLMYTTGSATGTYDTATGTVVITGNTENPSTTVYFYPAQPVMHIGTYEVTGVNAEETIAFDTQFAYQYTATTGWDRISAGTSSWTPGTQTDYYWSTNWTGDTQDDYIFYVTNNVVADNMRFWTGGTWTAWGGSGSTDLDSAGTTYIQTAKIIEPFYDRLLLFGPTEFDGATNQTFKNRIRYSANFSEAAPNSNTAWLISTGAGFIDLPTREAIVTVARIKDVMLAFCERSVYRLTPTGNGLSPYLYEELNSEVGVESVNSPIEFDRAVLGFGASGIHASNGQDVQRIDEAIPSTIYDVSNANTGHRRVTGIRDFFNEYAYWSYNSFEEQTTNNLIWPNRVLLYDYLKQNWAFMDDSISAMGYFWQQTAVDSKQLNFKSVLCGNQQGWTFRLRDDTTRNSQALQITNISFVTTTVTITSIAHNLTNDSWVYIANVVSDNGALETQLNGNIFEVTTTTVDAFTVTVSAEPTGATYRGCGTIERVDEPEILTKEYNFYGEQSRQIAFQQCNFYVDSTTNGEFTVDFIPSASSVSLLTDATASGALLGTNILETTPLSLVTLEASQDRFWHSVTFSATGEYVQLRLYLSDAQLVDVDGSDYVAFQDIQINGMIYFVTPTSEFV